MTEKGSVTIPVFLCIFNGHESITSFTKEFDVNLYQTLPNLYAVCLSDNNDSARKIVAGFFVKTSYSHEDPEFLDEITSIAKSSEELKMFVGEKTSYLPARLSVEGSAPLSESVMLRVMSQQLLKFSAGGNA